MIIEEIIEYKDDLVRWYDSIENIVDYFIYKKEEKVENLNNLHIGKDMFNDWTMEPKDMDISIEVTDGSFHNLHTQTVCSMPLESQIGRQVNIGIKENKTGKWLGFTRIASPILSIRPRNEMFGQQVDNKLVNQHMVNGCQIIPVQPFGYNCLGGKLIGLISNSHEVRDIYNKKYNTNVIHWETTSLYGDIKNVSQYDGLKPFIRYIGMTESNNFLFPTNKVYYPLLDAFREYYGMEEWDGRLVSPKGSGPKMREFTKVISIIKSNLKQWDEEQYNEFHKFTKEKMKSFTKKRFYYSNYGYENVIEHITKGEELREGQNFHKHKLDYIIEWWKKKAQKRWEKLNREGRIRTELEIYTKDTVMNKDRNDIIR